ncbi:MAG TPA: arginase family protein [Longimicrobiales bacterium]
MNGPAVELIVVPWDSGRRGWRMGAGPLHLAGRVHSRLEALGLDVHEVTIDPSEMSDGDPASAFAIAADVARRVAHARSGRRFPIVLAGNCSTALGTVAGMGAGSTGVVWFDAHGDFNTPHTSPSGFLDGMSLAMLTGRCCTSDTARVPGFHALTDDAIVLAGARDLDDGERRLIETSGVRVVAPGSVVSEQLAAAAEGWPPAVTEAYLHVDLDVLDPEEAIANAFAARGGIGLTDLLACIDAVATHVPIGAAALTALDPEADVDGRATAAALAVVEQILARADYGGPA